MTPFWTHGSMRSRGGVDKWFSNGASDVEYFFTETPVDIIRPGDFSSGNLTSMLQSNVLTAVTTPAYQQALTGGADDPLGVGFTGASADSFDAATTSVYDINGIAFAWLFTFKPTSALVANHMVAGKFVAGDGYVFFATNATTWQGRFDNSGVNSTAGSVGTADYVLLYQNPSTPRSGVYTGTSGDSGGAAVPNLSGSTTFSLGSIGAFLAQDCVVGPSVLWTGSAAANVIAARATDLPAWWSS